MIDIEQKVQSRSYQSPSRARAALGRSGVKPKDKARIGALIDQWENEGTVDHIVAGMPEALEAELVGAAKGERAGFWGEQLPSQNGKGPFLALREARMLLNLDALVRVRLTVAGIARLYAVRDQVAVPDNLLERGGVWETSLWELASVLGPHLAVGTPEALIANNCIEVLDARVGA